MRSGLVCLGVLVGFGFLGCDDNSAPPDDVDGGSTDAPTPVTCPGVRLSYLANEGADSEIYSVTLDGATPTNISRSPGHDGVPVWAPNGLLLAFFSERADGRGIYAADPAGQNLRRVVEVATPYATVPSWSPSSDRLAYHDGPGDAFDIFVVDLAGGTPRRITTDARSESQAQWSPDGDDLLFVRGWSVVVVSADGSNERVVAANAGPLPDAKWTPDGNVAWVQASRVWVAARDGQSPATAASPADVRVKSHAWAPNGTVVLAATNAQGPGVFVSAPPFDAASRVVGTAWETSSPRFSPDGSWIAYIDVADQARVHVVAPSASATPTVIAEAVLANWGPCPPP